MRDAPPPAARFLHVGVIVAKQRASPAARVAPAPPAARAAPRYSYASDPDPETPDGGFGGWVGAPAPPPPGACPSASPPPVRAAAKKAVAKIQTRLDREKRASNDFSALAAPPAGSEGYGETERDEDDSVSAVFCCRPSTLEDTPQKPAFSFANHARHDINYTTKHTHTHTHSMRRPPSPALIVVCGGPATGKSAATAAVAAALAAAGRNVAVVNDASAGHATPADAYKGVWRWEEGRGGRGVASPLPMLPRSPPSDPLAEKQTRGALRSSAERALASTPPPAAVIVDSLNHVKGFRYELWCAARAAGAAHTVVWCPRRVVNVGGGASARPPNGGWPDALATDLAAREEAPDPRNRWDAPLFVGAVDGAPPPAPHAAAPPALPAGGRGAGGQEPAWSLDAVAAAVVAAVCGVGGGDGGSTTAATPPPSSLTPAISTTGARSAPADGLADLDATLQAVVVAIAGVAAQRAGGALQPAPPPITLPAAGGAPPTTIHLSRPLPLAELRRAKRDYLRAVTAPLAGAPPRGGAAARGFGAWLERVSEGGR